ncbi:MAG: aldehyde reductase [Aureispira sp.]|nr:aldehyde reductase [Aureispira sp.]
MKEITPKASVLVTGASGYIASWIVKYLLEGGYTVHATVRNKSKTVKIDHLLKMQANYPNQLKFFEADLLKKGTFEAAMQGCELVIHTASPFKTKVKDAQKELIQPALDGTINVLDTVNKTSSVKRVVLTSSVVAIYGDAVDMENTAKGTFTEEHWNSTSNANHQPYPYSKTVAERKAWEMTDNQKNWDLVVINPGFVLGPSLSNRKDSTSTDFMCSMLGGDFKTGTPALVFGVVDVRDVAKAHVLAGTIPTAKGRHILSASSYSMLELADFLRKNYGDRKLPKKELPKFLIYMAGPLTAGLSWKYINKNVGYPLLFDNSYSIKDLGIQYREIETTLNDQAAQLIKDKLV